MRTIFSIIALFSLCGLRAQEYTPTYGRELPRGEVIAYPTQQEASAANGGDNRHFTRITEWLHEGNSFSTPITVPFAWANRQVLLHIGSASADYEVRINGKAVAYNSNGNSPAEFNITRDTNEGRNTLEIVISNPSSVAPLESWKQSPPPAIGEVWLSSQPTLRVRDVLIKTWCSADSVTITEVGIVVKSSALNPRTSRIYYQLLTPAGETVATGQEDITLKMQGEDTLRFIAAIPPHLLWSAELPTRYTLRVKTRHEGRDVEFLESYPGFRAVAVRRGEMSINGKPITLRIRKVSPRITENEIAELREQGYNTLMLQPGATPQALYDFCDMQGLYVIAQAPIDTQRSGESRRQGGNPTNNPAWMGAYIERTADSYHTTKRHPSVIAFSLAEKSANGINLYESYLNVKRFGDARPFIYPDAAGEWNSDQLKLE